MDKAFYFRHAIIIVAISVGSLLPVREAMADAPTTQRAKEQPPGQQRDNPQQPEPRQVDGAATKVAVYDIDRIAHDLGWARDMQTSMDEVKKEFELELAHLKKMYTQQIMDQKKKWAPKNGDRLTADQQQILNSMNTYANEVLKQINQNASQLLVRYRQQWITEYHRALRPILEQIAMENQLAIILEQNDSVQFVQPSADISEAVTDLARAHPPVIHPVRGPQLPDPGPMTVKWPDTQPTTEPAEPAQ